MQTLTLAVLHTFVLNAPKNVHKTKAEVLCAAQNADIMYSCILQSKDVKPSQVRAQAHSTLPIINC